MLVRDERQMDRLPPEVTRRINAGEAVVWLQAGVNCSVRLRAYVRVPASSEDVWRTITDYDHLADVVPGMVESRVVGHNNGEKLVHQVARLDEALGLSAAVTLAVTEEPPKAVRFRAVDGDMRRMEGAWRVRSWSDGAVLLEYEVELQPARWTPCWIVKRKLKQGVPEQLHAIARAAAQ
jgi:ribosome-associated toxin RatA of RatAB toxin-antitoxin module